MTVVTTEELSKVLKDSEKALSELHSKLENVSVNVGRNSTSVIEAIRQVFGENYIKSDGSSEITFEMYRKTIDKIKELGELKVQESI